MADKWDKSREKKAGEGFSSADVADFSSTQKGGQRDLSVNHASVAESLVVFLEKVESLHAFPVDHVAALDKLYAIDKSDNAEIKLRFYQIALKSGPEYAKEAAGELCC